MRTLLLVLLAIFAAGCRPAPAGVIAPQPTDPDEQLRAKISQGAFDLTAASDTLAQAKEAAAQLQDRLPKGEMGEDFLDLVEYLDSCGATVADHLDEPPALEAFRKQIPEQKKRLKEMIAAATDCIQELDEAVGLLDGMLESPPKGLEKELTDLADALDAAREDLATAIESMGGKPPAPPDGEEQAQG